MTDFSTWKVTDLKAELKRRGIPQTGLRVKQNFIDRLLEDDAKGETGGSAEETPSAPQEKLDEGNEKEEKKEDKPEPEQDAQQPPAEVPSQPQESQPEEPQPEEPQTEEKGNEESKPEEKVAPDAAAEETRDEPKPAEDPQAVEKPEEQSQQAQPEEPSKEAPQEAPEQAQSGDAMDHEPTEAPVVQPNPESETPAEPVEQAPGDAMEKEPTPAEKSVPSAPNASEVNTGLSTPLPAEEILEDTRKRKRRSQSPIPTPEALANKKARAENGSPKVSLPEDRVSEAASEGKNAKNDAAALSEERPNGPVQQETTTNQEAKHASVSEEPRAKRGAPPKQDARFKGLFAAERDQPRAASPPVDTEMEDAEVEPALHVATAALYVDGLMRPLQPQALRNHIVSLASGSGASPDPDVILDFYLDPIKTHCFVSFTSISAASRVRSVLHGTVWPNERNRKTLFVDFIPENKVQEWISREEGSRGRGGPAPRWEVKYDRTEDGVEAVLEEIDTKATGSRSQEPSHTNASFPAPPTGPRADKEDRRPSGPPPSEPRPRPGQGFKPLDELFMSTTAKPKLYYLPVPREVADRRLDRFDDILRKGSYPRRGGDETRRISFEDDDFFVDHGPEFAGRGRGGRGRGRGGGFGGSWRGDRRGRY
ncbi:hypothetical protein ASPWEDRAFT_102646 [Aspergillus wentii DTO 134E9]|uniref:SAP domain-containing protein n=1 Tax=Aspergillus wentii DTO 134E9 TaxID=1073089 RepID=A0A1L9S2Q2_ASPWE|nr:uncharacterized protein ASPWEDRAFT_102646 [Aspergillus wentii DTO 134E9]KAI9924485.1 hypothetical protein MW887_007112 [Aspergillus wentii]OJJ41445.1 hypothetical protein ASPWEDRAFT_102646 [Aspergillus wentii DTO 134E9]